MYHKDLDVYKKAVDFVIEIYKLTGNFPKEEIFGLSSQLRRAAISVPSNIAEGCARASDKQIYHFINIAIGSLAEIEAQLEIAYKLEYIADLSNIENSFQDLKSLLLGFKKHITKKMVDV